MKFLVYQTFYSAEECEIGYYLTDAINEEAALHKWQSMNCIDNESTVIDTAYGNRIEFDGIEELSEEEFEVLNKYIEKL